MKLYSATLLAVLMASTAQAHPFFKKELELKGGSMSLECSACHAKKNSKVNYKERNDFGKLFEKEFAGKNLLDRIKKVKDLPAGNADRNRVEAEVAKELTSAWNVISAKPMRKGLKYGDAFLNGFVQGAMLRPVLTQALLSDENRLVVNSKRVVLRYRKENRTRVVDGKQTIYTVTVPYSVQVTEKFEMPIENVQIYDTDAKLLSAADARLKLSSKANVAFIIRRSQDQAAALKEFPKFVKDFKNNTETLVMVAPEDWRTRGKQ